jgi:hypothetical protein
MDDWQHSMQEQCFFCASDEALARGIDLYEQEQPWDGRTTHFDLTEANCPRASSRYDDAPA